jgi:hypothetical protein
MRFDHGSISFLFLPVYPGVLVRELSINHRQFSKQHKMFQFAGLGLICVFPIIFK